MTQYKENSEKGKSPKELLYVYIYDYKMFKCIGFSLCPRYDIIFGKDSSTIIIKEKEHFVDLFKDYGLNIKIICGENAVGKTTLLKLIEERAACGQEDVFFLFKDADGKLFVRGEVGKPHLLETIDINFCGTIHKLSKADESLCNSMGSAGVSTEYQIHFDAGHGLLPNEMFEKNVVPFYVKNKSLFDDLAGAEKANAFFTHFMVNLCQKQELKGEIETFRSKLQSDIFTEKQDIAHFPAVEKELQDAAQDFPLNIRNDLYTFTGIRKVNDVYVSFENFSEGERQFAQCKYAIYYAIEGIQEKTNTSMNVTWLCVDEPETSLHPEWARSFLYAYIEAFKQVRKYIGKDCNRRYSVFFSTHSPFLLSDVTKDYVIYLKRENELTVYQHEQDTFAGNIGEMFSTNFFMTKTIGEFASRRIQKLIENIRKGAVSAEDRLLVEAVGDTLLRKLLQEMIRAESFTHDSKEGKKEDETNRD